MTIRIPIVEIVLALSLVCACGGKAPPLLPEVASHSNNDESVARAAVERDTAKGGAPQIDGTSRSQSSPALDSTLSPAVESDRQGEVETTLPEGNSQAARDSVLSSEPQSSSTDEALSSENMEGTTSARDNLKVESGLDVTFNGVAGDPSLSTTEAVATPSDALATTSGIVAKPATQCGCVFTGVANTWRCGTTTLVVDLNDTVTINGQVCQFTTVN